MPLYAHIKTDNTDGWYRVLYYDDLLNPTTAQETQTYLDDLLDMHKLALSQRLLNNPDILASMLKKLKHPQKELEEKNILYVNRVGGYYPDPTDNDIIEIKELPQRPLEKGTGFTGWLDSNGQFYESTYGTHQQIAWNHDIDIDEGSIYMTCAKSPITHEITDLIQLGLYDLTEKQLEWFHTYRDQLSKNQHRMIDKILKGT